MCMVCINIHIYIYIHTYVRISKYVYIYIHTDNIDIILTGVRVLEGFTKALARIIRFPQRIHSLCRVYRLYRLMA